ncbi:MAG: tetratricopeptide repeat protein [Pseudohongiella sp.]|nr:tetratricopeptide repeat protein [Pseudohongiella sp.]
MLSACQFAGLSPGFREDDALELQILGTDTRVPDVDLLALDQSVIDYLDANIEPGLASWALVERLQVLLFTPEFLDIQYDDAANFTATEAFKERRANCLSLVNLYIGMARHLGLDVRYQTVQIRPMWNRRGELLVLSEHINALGRVGPSNQYIVDFTPEIRLQQHTAEVITDRQAQALYFNNLAVEHLVEGRTQEALELFRVALALDDALAMAWNNIGSALGRLNQPTLAEYSFLKASLLDRSNASAVNNLARYYAEIGETAKSQRYRRAVQSYNNRNPYYHYMLGNLAYEEKNFDAARDHFQEAIRRNDLEPDFYLALGMTFRELGDTKAYDDLSMMSLAIRELGDQTYRASQNRLRRLESRSILRSTSAGLTIQVVD